MISGRSQNLRAGAIPFLQGASSDGEACRRMAGLRDALWPSPLFPCSPDGFVRAMVLGIVPRPWGVFHGHRAEKAFGGDLGLVAVRGRRIC